MNEAEAEKYLSKHYLNKVTTQCNTSVIYYKIPNTNKFCRLRTYYNGHTSSTVLSNLPENNYIFVK